MVKFFIYISDMKVDMLLAQIPKNILNRIAADLSINLGVISVTLKQKQNEQTRYDKVKLVTNYIEKHVDVGDIDYPKTYFKATIPMRWGPYLDGDNLVYFGGETSNTIFGLGGSMHHVIGEEKGQSPTHSGSLTPVILSTLEKEQANSPDQHMDDLEAVKMMTEAMKGPLQCLEFLGKRLIDGLIPLDYSDQSSPKKHVLLGTPIYVAYGN